MTSLRLTIILTTFATLILTTTPEIAFAGVVSIGDEFTDDASTLINSSETYTHAISGGQAVTVNSVNFALLDSGNTPANFTWTPNGGTNKSQVVNMNGDWVPATGGVTGTEIQGLLNDFTYSGSGSDVGASQTFTLSGLIIGQDYDTRLYIRAWDDAGSGRDIDLTFTHGLEINNFTFEEDRPQNAPISLPSVHSAYFLSYAFTAQATSLTIDAEVAAGGDGSFHLYGLTNQEVTAIPEPSTLTLLALTGLGGLFYRRRKS